MKFAMILIVLACASQAHAQSYYPTGPQTNVALSTITDGGWSICSQSTYVSQLAGFPASCPQTDKLMLACRATGSATIQLLAAAPASDVLTETGDTATATHNANGSEWYYDTTDAGGDYAIGFAKGGDPVQANSCDVLTTGANDERLCFHIYESVDNGGYRCGANDSLNNSAAYEKLFFMSDADGDGVGDTRDAYPLDPSRSVVQQANEIPTLPLFGLLTLAGLLGLFGLRKLRQ